MIVKEFHRFIRYSYEPNDRDVKIPITFFHDAKLCAAPNYIGRLTTVMYMMAIPMQTHETHPMREIVIMAVRDRFAGKRGISKKAAGEAYDLLQAAGWISPEGWLMEPSRDETAALCDELGRTGRAQ